MQSILSRFNAFFEQAPNMLLPWRWLVLAVFLSSSGFMLYGMMTKFNMDMSLESWFQKDDPAKNALDVFRKQFGSDDGLYIVYRAKDGDVFSEQSLATLRQLHQELDNARVGLDANDQPMDAADVMQLKRIERIDSLFNARYQIADGDTLISKKLIGREFPQNDAEREARRDIAKGQDSFELAYYSKDFQHAGIRIKTDFGTVVKNAESLVDTSEDALLETDDLLMDGDDLLDDDLAMSKELSDGFAEDLVVDESLAQEEIKFEDMQMDEYLYFMKDIKKITEQSKYDHFEFYYTGNAPMMEFAMENMEQASKLTLLMVLIVVGLLWFLFHSLSAVFWPLIVIAASGFWTIGAASWLDVTMSNMVSLTFMMILAVGIADCVHVLSAYILFRREQHPHREAMALAYRKTGLPIFLTSITTMAGMSALVISDIPQIAVFGLMSAMGVGMAFLLTVFVLPVLLDIWHPYNDKKVAKIKSKKAKHWLQPLLDSIPEFVGKRYRSIVLAYMGIFALFLYGASLTKVDSNFAELTKEGSTIRVTYELVDQEMMGGQNMEIMLDLGVADGVKDPEVLKVIDRLQRHVEQEYDHYVVKTFSLSDFVKDTNKVMHEDDPAYKTIPDDARLTAQLIYLFDNANPEDRRNLVSDDYSKTHITIQLRNAGSYEYTQFFNDVQEDIERYFAPVKATYPNLNINVTGTLALMMELIDHISWTQIKSFSFALLIITILMMVTLGSKQAGLISMVPNLLPAFFTFGFMGLIGMPLDTDTLIIAPLIIGIAVDDTIHFIAHYRDAWYEHGDIDKALHSTIKEVGQAVTFTTLILGIGFSTLAFSDYLGLAKTGIFGSMAIFVALSSDLLLLPALIKWIKPDLGRKKYLAKNSEAATQS